MKNSLLLSIVLIAFCSFSAEGLTAQSCFESQVMSPAPLMGNDGEIVRLADGSYWQVKYEYEYMYEYYPSVLICPERSQLIVGDTRLNVQPVRVITESYIANDFDGLERGNIYRLGNGQIWEQVEAWIWIWIWINPRVLLYQDGSVVKMKVENIDHAVVVERIG